MSTALNGWTPVALAADLPPGGVLRTVVEAQDLAVWRSRSGQVRAWDNRCPHRGMRLSFGFVRGESLTCIYHGWQYGTDGICHTIPAHPDLTPPSTLCVNAFACAEKDSLIWAALSETGEAPGIGVEAAEPVRSLTVDRDIRAVSGLLAEARFPIKESRDSDEGDYVTSVRADDLIIREGRRGDGRRLLVAALQPLPAERTACHILTSPGTAPMVRKTLSRWLERFRRSAESEDVDTGSWRPVAGAVGA
jgi:nitrite reductase/ring-hydroxylating ferredoxin subunit